MHALQVNPARQRATLRQRKVIAQRIHDRKAMPFSSRKPHPEFRHELTGPTAKMELLGYLVRTGTDLRYRMSDHATGVIQAQLAFGTLQDQGTSVSILGPRLGALIEWSR